CVHGVERWRSDCGCNSGGKQGWKQHWRAPLRELMDWVRDQMRETYIPRMTEMGLDPWEIRNAYIDIILDRGNTSINQFFEKHFDRELTPEEKVNFFRMMEVQRNCLLMYTSCAWFFDEISGIETNQVLQYALRAIRYHRRLTKVDLYPYFVQRLKEIPSNKHPNGSVSFQKHVIPSQLDLRRMAMHVGLAVVFSDSPTDFELYNIRAKAEIFKKYRAGTQRMVVGRTQLQSMITHVERTYYFATVYAGQHNFIGQVSKSMRMEDFSLFQEQVEASFETGNLSKVIALIHEYFGKDHYSIWKLLRDEKQKILQEITRRSLVHGESAFHELYNDNYQLMNSMQQSGLRIPYTFIAASRFVLNSDLREIMEAHPINLFKLRDLLADLKKWKIEIQDLSEFLLAAGERIYYEIRLIVAGGGSEEDIWNLIELIDILTVLNGDLDLWKSQNVYFSKYKKLSAGRETEVWKKEFLKLGEKLGMAV
ncbi:MAG: DUF3536 domain-containing protein, partial [Saprospiraceae bacterium]|nr:DUF3536 domain-containing protein [Saprospiraceae bacterium]